jgi:hypothetical protein
LWGSRILHCILWPLTFDHDTRLPAHLLGNASYEQAWNIVVLDIETTGLSFSDGWSVYVLVTGYVYVSDKHDEVLHSYHHWCRPMDHACHGMQRHYTTLCQYGQHASIRANLSKLCRTYLSNFGPNHMSAGISHPFLYFHAASRVFQS